ncbi:MAG: hypothetical protein CVU38_11635 [Chloroflexi bacterium HGW-Chloroflexi-1]|nr:MAG: hypothetical protein CVU38_11635 [Chloroflexi bacterium HGW-Chloroflexi-1]
MPTLEVTLSEPAYVVLEQTACERRQPVEAIVRDALSIFLRLPKPETAEGSVAPAAATGAWRRAGIHIEAKAWRAMPATVRRRYGSEFVAVHNGQVVDHDPDRLVLYRRVHERVGNVPVLITPADAPSPREFWILSPHFERAQ